MPASHFERRKGAWEEEIMNSLKECAELFERLGLTELFVKDGEQELRLTKQYACPSPAMVSAPALQAVPVQTDVEEPAEKESVKTAEIPAGEMIKAALLGIFHGRAQEGAVKIGDTVKKGETLWPLHKEYGKTITKTLQI